MALNNEFKVKNDLNTLGRILSGGTDLATIFSPSNTSWTLSATNGTFGVAGGDTVQFQGSNGVDVRIATGTDTVRVSGIDATTSVKGVASFHADNFLVTNGVVTVKDGGILNEELAGSITDNKLSTISTALKVSNSATTATSANTANAIVARGASGEFSSGSITATGNLSASGTVTGNNIDVKNILSVGAAQVRTVGPSNVFLGDGTTGRNATTGLHNFVFGLNAGSALTVGGYNNFFGANAGAANTSGNNNNFLGRYAGAANYSGSQNNFLGRNAGTANTSGSQNNFLGEGAGCFNRTGSHNIFIGNNANTASAQMSALSGVIVLGAGAVATESHQIVLSTANISFRSLTGTNLFIGNDAGNSTVTGKHNFVFGLSAGNALTSGSNNVFIGACAGRLTTGGLSYGVIPAGRNNNFLGNAAGYDNTAGRDNNFFGCRAGSNNTTGNSNNFLGYCAGLNNTSGNNNNFLGNNTGHFNTTGGCNNFLGLRAGFSNTTGSHNNFFGNDAGRLNTTGGSNNFLGRYAGYFNRTGSNNIFIGSNANTASAQMSALSGVIVLGTGAVATQTNQIVLSTADISLRTLKGSAAGPNVFIGDSTTGNDNATGNHNFVFGLSAGNALTTGSNNVFIGACAGRLTTGGLLYGIIPAGRDNNFLGAAAGFSNTTGGSNNFFGPNAGAFNTTGRNNNFLGNAAGYSNTSGGSNNFFGNAAGLCNTTGGSNNFLGLKAGFSNTTGGNNNFLGYRAGCFNIVGSDNIFIGNNANTASAQMSALSGVIVLGAGAVATESHQIVLSTANVSFRNIGSTFEIGTPSLTDNLTVYGAVSSTGIVNTNTGFRVNNGATTGNFLRGDGTNFVSSAIQVSDVSTLNQNTTGSAATLGTTQTLWGQNFNGSQSVTGSLTGVGNITGSSAITIQPFATNQDISLTTSGTGEVNIAKVDIDSGTIDGVSIGTASAVTQLVVDEVYIDSATIGLKSGSTATELRINTGSASGSSNPPVIFNGGAAGANAIISSGIGGDLILGTHLNDAARARLTLDDATNGNITFGLNGTGSVVISKADINGGAIDGTTIGSSSASTGSFTQVVVDNITIDGNTISSTNANGNIDLTPNGTGEVNITKVDIDAGTIDGTAIGASTASTGRFTTLETSGNVTINGNLTVSGSATQIETSNLVISDPIIFLGEGNQTDIVDIGFTAAYNHGQPIPRHTGLIRDSFTQQWTLFSNLSTEILSAVQIPLDNPSIQIDTLKANIIGTVTGNLSGMASQIADGSVSTNKIVNSNVTYAKIQNVSATDKILGRSTAGAGVVEEIACTLAGRDLLDDASASAQRTTLGVGTTDSVTFGEVIVNNGTISVLNDVFNASSSNNTHTLTTFAKANYNSAKFTIQIKQGNNRCLFEVLTTNDNGTWNGTVYGLVGADLLDNIDITTVNTTVDLAFTFKGTATARTMTVYAQAISD